MSKRTNTILFMLGATVFNVVMIVVIFAIFFLLYGALLAPVTPPQIAQVVVIVLGIGAIALTYFIYHRVIKWISKKWNLDDHFDPIFTRREK